MTHREVTYVPGLYKIFDEILVYAADNKQGDPSMNSLSPWGSTCPTAAYASTTAVKASRLSVTWRMVYTCRR